MRIIGSLPNGGVTADLTLDEAGWLTRRNDIQEVGLLIVAEMRDLNVAFRQKPGDVPMSFSATLLLKAGGIERLLREWERVRE